MPLGGMGIGAELQRYSAANYTRVGAHDYLTIYMFIKMM